MSNVTIKDDYREGGRHSFFADMVRKDEDPSALDRLQRHARSQAEKRHAAPEGVEFRVNPNADFTGEGAEFAPPLWLIDKFASASRAGRTLADLIGSQPLPRGVSSVNVPRMTTAFVEGVSNDLSAQPSGDLVTTAVTSTVQTLSGMADVSMQLLEQSPSGFDTYAYIDLNRAYNRALESQLLTGTGTAGQLLGLLNVTGTTSVSGSSATTIATLWPLLGQAAAGVGNNRLLPPEACLMAPRRWFWVASSIDNSNRPVASPTPFPHVGELGMAGGALPMGAVLGLPVWADGAIPAGSSADTAVFCRPSDMFLFESEPFYITASNPLSGTLQARLSLHRHVAFLPHRYPSGIGLVTALPQPSNF